jgi:hypothetical protein
MQEGVPWLLLHAVLHPPQLAGLLLVSVSQPSRLTFSFPLQSLHPMLHAMVQAPATQLPVPWLALHAWPHPPQLPALVFRSTSQPFPRFPSQFANPAWHANWHDPSEQPVAVMFAGVFAAHEYPQDPQFVALVLMSVSQPSVTPALRSLLQSFQPLSHVCWQLLALQIGLACAARSSHTTLHPPQLFTSLAVFVSQPLRLTFSFALQSAKPALHTAMLH